MASTAFIWLKRLNPLAWGGIAIGLALAAVVGQQYLRHPDWRGAFRSAADYPAQPNYGARLSPEERAQLAEIDNLTLLLNQLQPQTANLTAESQGTAEDSPRHASSLHAGGRPQGVAPESSAGPPPAVSDSPFAIYLERTQFKVGGGGQVTSPGSSDLSSPNESGVRLDSATNFFSRSGIGGLAPVAQGDAAGSSARGWPGATLTSSGPTSVPETSRNPAAPEEDQATAADSGLTPPWLVEGTLPGTTQSFIRTTPQMSPPPGTTGYTLPPSLQPQQTGTPSALPAAAPLDLNFSRITEPELPNLSPPSLRPGAGVPGSTNNSYSQPQALPEPAPFTVPRPPGSYTGGGFINTFSDPNGP
ncbi:MAG: hypothetical protein ACFCVD_23170 [Nodosilinea sp.]